MADQVVARSAGEGNAIWMLGGLYEVKAAAEETGRNITAMEFTVPVGAAPPPHVHDCWEAIYVAEGSGTFHADGRSIEAGPGSFFYFPAGTTETFEPKSEMRVFVIYGKGGMDEFFAEAGEPAASREPPPPPDGPPDLEQMAAIASRYGLELKAPEPA